VSGLGYKEWVLAVLLHATAWTTTTPIPQPLEESMAMSLDKRTHLKDLVHHPVLLYELEGPLQKRCFLRTQCQVVVSQCRHVSESDRESQPSLTDRFFIHQDLVSPIN
jgi:hypothetical protein